MKRYTIYDIAKALKGLRIPHEPGGNEIFATAPSPSDLEVSVYRTANQEEGLQPIRAQVWIFSQGEAAYKAELQKPDGSTEIALEEICHTFHIPLDAAIWEITGNVDYTLDLEE